VDLRFSGSILKSSWHVVITAKSQDKPTHISALTEQNNWQTLFASLLHSMARMLDLPASSVAENGEFYSYKGWSLIFVWARIEVRKISISIHNEYYIKCISEYKYASRKKRNFLFIILRFWISLEKRIAGYKITKYKRVSGTVVILELMYVKFPTNVLQNQSA
jgi:hypothetical protein